MPNIPHFRVNYRVWQYESPGRRDKYLVMDRAVRPETLKGIGIPIPMNEDGRENPRKRYFVIGLSEFIGPNGKDLEKLTAYDGETRLMYHDFEVEGYIGFLRHLATINDTFETVRNYGSNPQPKGELSELLDRKRLEGMGWHQTLETRIVKPDDIISKDTADFRARYS